MPAHDVAPPGPARRLAAGLLLAATAAAAGAGCAGPERSEPPVSEDLYVEVMARLAAIRAASPPRRPTDTVSRIRVDSLRRSVLAERGISREDLKTFARAVGDEPGRMKALWKRIGARADSLVGSGWPVDTATSPADSAASLADSLASDPDTAPDSEPDTGPGGDPDISGGTGGGR